MPEKRHFQTRRHILKTGALAAGAVAASGGLEWAAVTSPSSRSRAPLLLRFLAADEVVDARCGWRAHEARPELLAT